MKVAVWFVDQRNENFETALKYMYMYNVNWLTNFNFDLDYFLQRL